MSKDNAAQTQQSQAAEAPKAPSKMALAKVIYDEVFAPGYDLDGKSQRYRFIERVMAEVPNASKNLANTYYQNISNMKRGKALYAYNTYQSKKSSDKGEGAPTNTNQAPASELPGAAGQALSKAAVRKAEEQATKTAVDLTKRWQVKDGNGNVINTFDTRKEAKDEADKGETWTWADGQKK